MKILIFYCKHVSVFEKGIFQHEQLWSMKKKISTDQIALTRSGIMYSTLKVYIICAHTTAVYRGHVHSENIAQYPH